MSTDGRRLQTGCHPDVFIDLVGGEEFPGVFHEESKNIELAGSERNRLSEIKDRSAVAFDA